MTSRGLVGTRAPSARRRLAALAGVAAVVLGTAGAAAAAPSNAGLWVGEIEAAQVSEIGAAGVGAPTAVAQPLRMKLLLHQDGTGQVRLLKQVIQMWQDGTTNPDGTIATPGHYVLVTDDAKIPDFKGAALRDGAAVGRRLSSALFDFAGNELPLAGGLLASGRTLTGTITVAKDDPRNPYYAKYHPEHDGKDWTFGGSADEVPAITRAVSLALSNRYPVDLAKPVAAAPPGWFGGGEGSEIGGVYAETITGLYKSPVTVTGTFRLRCVSGRDVLNQ